MAAKTEKSLVPIGKFDPSVHFLDDKYKDVISFVKSESTLENPTVATKKGQAEIKSNSANIASSRAFLKKMRLEHTNKIRDEIKDRIDTIIKNGGLIDDELKEWQIKQRKPLTDLEEKEKTDQWNEAVRVEIIRLHGEGLEDNRLFNEKRQFKIDKKKLDEEKIQIAADKKARDKITSEDALKIANANKKEKNAKIAVGNARKTLLDAMGETFGFQAIMDMDQISWDVFYEGISDKHQAEKTRLKGISDQKIKDDAEAEVQRKADKKESDRLESDRVKKEAADKKAADIGHRQKINNEVLADLLPILEKLNETEPDEPFSFTDAAKEITKAIIRKQIRNVSINY